MSRWAASAGRVLISCDVKGNRWLSGNYVSISPRHMTPGATTPVGRRFPEQDLYIWSNRRGGKSTNGMAVKRQRVNPDTGSGTESQYRESYAHVSDNR